MNRAGVLDAGRVLRCTMTDVWYETIPLIFLNLLWLFCCVPIVTIPPATAALYVTVHKKAQYHSSTWRDFLIAMRDYFWVGWRWILLNLLAAGVFSIGLWVYGRWQTPGMRYFLLSLWWGGGLAWVIVQMYCFPVLLAQERPSVILALRNAFVLCVRHPIFTLIYALVTALLCSMSIVMWVAWPLFTVALIAFIYQRGVSYLIKLEQK